MHNIDQASLCFLENNENVSVAQVIEKGQTKAKRSVFAFLTVFLISGFCSRSLSTLYQFSSPNAKLLISDFILAYTLIGLEMHLFVTYGFHRVTPSEYHRSRRSSKFGFLFFLLYMQV